MSTFVKEGSPFTTSGAIYALVVKLAKVSLWTSCFLPFFERPKSVIYRILKPLGS
jgi:hypothetical protein